MATADVMITIDSETIVTTYGRNTNSANPPLINPNYIYMVVAQKNVINGQGGGELSLRVRVGDNIRWRESSLSGGTEQQVLMYQFVSTDPSNQLISNPEPLVTHPTVPMPDPNNPTRPTPTEITDNFWQCTAKNRGSVTYHFKFMVTDRDCNVLGYYQWDPFITITG